MTTAEKPFFGETTLDVMKQILEKTPVEPQVFRKQIPGELNYLIMAMIARDPEIRPSAGDTLNALKTIEFPGEPEIQITIIKQP